MLIQSPAENSAHNQPPVRRSTESDLLRRPFDSDDSAASVGSLIAVVRISLHLAAGKQFFYYFKSTTENFMKTRKKPSHRRFQLKILYGDAYYIDRVARLKAKLAKKPRSLQIDMVGAGDIPADTALQIRSALTRRWAQTRIITHAHSSLQGGSVLVWLLGDKRVIRDDAKLFFRRTTLPEDAEAKP